MDTANYFRCSACGYEFLSKSETAKCPRCGNVKLEVKDSKALVGFDD